MNRFFKRSKLTDQQVEKIAMCLLMGYDATVTSKIVEKSLRTVNAHFVKLRLLIYNYSVVTKATSWDWSHIYELYNIKRGTIEEFNFIKSMIYLDSFKMCGQSLFDRIEQRGIFPQHYIYHLEEIYFKRAPLRYLEAIIVEQNKIKPQIQYENIYVQCVTAFRLKDFKRLKYYLSLSEDSKFEEDDCEIIEKYIFLVNLMYKAPESLYLSSLISI